MSRAHIAGLVVAATALAAAMAWWLRDEAAPAGAAPAANTATQVLAEPVRPAQSAIPAPQSQDPVSLAPERSLEQRFNEAEDLLAFIESIRGAARDGDGPSAWWIYRALQRCDTEYKIYFQRRGRLLTLDEALQLNSRDTFLPIDETRKLHAQCGRLLETDSNLLGAWVYWVAAAASRGIPLARLEMARHLLSTADGSNAETFRARARELTIAALQSKDPEVMAALGRLTTTGLAGSWLDSEWLLAACQRGLDCGPRSGVVTGYCRYDMSCQPFEDVEAILRRVAAAEYDDIERRAREINQLIDQDRFEELVSAQVPPK